MSDNVIYIIIAIMILGPIIILFFISANNQKRVKEIEQYAKRNKLSFKKYFDKFIKDCGNMRCFSEMIDPNFCYVIEKPDKENGNIYVGELHWDISVKNHRRSSSSSMYHREGRECTLCVLYDDGFNLPDFDLLRETLKEKAVEVLGMNQTEDIDFDDDKDFSDAWWLSSNENMVVRELFTRNIRSNFMSFVDKGYRICGKANVLFIITDKPLWPQDYSKLTSDIRMIQRFMKNNKKFYTPYSEREKEGNEEEGNEQLS